MHQPQCPVCYGPLELREVGPCVECGGDPQELEHLREGRHTYQIMRILGGSFEVLLCNFCMVDFGSTDPTYFGLPQGTQIGLETMEFVRAVPGTLGKDMFCPDCNRRLAFLRLVAESRERGNMPDLGSKPTPPSHPSVVIQGYVYCSHEDGDMFSGAKVGEEIIHPTQAPPWIVVVHHVRDVLVTRWPGRLFWVQVLDPAAETHLMDGIRKDAGYTRTCGVRILEELPVANLFGENGDGICRIVELTRRLTEGQVDTLSGYDLSASEQIYDQVWRKCSAPQIYGGKQEVEACGTVLKSALTDGKYSSPIGEGLSVVYALFHARAKELAGDAAYEIDERDEDDDEDDGVSLLPKWSQACDALLHAAMSYAPDPLLTVPEKSLLRKPVEDVFGQQESDRK